MITIAEKNDTNYQSFALDLWNIGSSLYSIDRSLAVQVDYLASFLFNAKHFEVKVFNQGKLIDQECIFAPMCLVEKFALNYANRLGITFDRIDIYKTINLNDLLVT